VLPISGVSPDPGRTRGITMNKGSDLPLRKCPECGGSYFRQVKLHREPGTEMVDMPMSVLMCLCGAVQRPNVGGVRGGRTPNRLTNKRVWHPEPKPVTK
jgi:hypothetical protein